MATVLATVAATWRRARAGLEEVHLNPADKQISDMVEAAVKALTDMGKEFKGVQGSSREFKKELTTT